MADKDILQSVYPHIGGQENISRTIPRENILYVMLKDAGAVDLDSVRQRALKPQNWSAAVWRCIWLDRKKRRTPWHRIIKRWAKPFLKP